MGKCSEVLRILRQDGWFIERRGKGSHVILRLDFFSKPRFNGNGDRDFKPNFEKGRFEMTATPVRHRVKNEH
jgi:hypothetical protein